MVDNIIELGHRLLEEQPTAVDIRADQNKEQHVKNDKIQELGVPSITIKVYEPRMRPPNITRMSQVTQASQALALLEGMLNACIRPGRFLKAEARDIYTLLKERRGKKYVVTKAVLPLDDINSESQNTEAKGSDVEHFKSPEKHGFLAVMLVVLRPLMRRLLRGTGHTLCTQIGPVDENGAVFSVIKLLELFQFVGRHTLGLSHWGYNINRSIHASNTALVAYDKGLDEDSPFFKKVMRRNNMSEFQSVAVYATGARQAEGTTPDALDARCTGPY